MTAAVRRAFPLILILIALAAAGVRAQTPPPADDPWGFEDETHEETLADILRPQWIDIGLTAALLGLTSVSFALRSRPLKYATLAATVAYLGVYKGTMISVTDLFRFIDLSLPDYKNGGVYWFLFAGFTVVTTALFGRLYCGRICAFGAFTQLLDAVVPKSIRREPPPWLEKKAGYVKYGLLVAVLLYYIVTHDTFVYRYVEPFWMFTGSGNPVMWTMLAVLLAATLVVRNLYCRFLCPVGAALGVISQVTTFLPIKRWSECKTCKICEKACEWGAIQGPKIIKSECVRCDDCERIYDDKKKCVHWLIIVKKENLAKKAATAAPSPAMGS